MDARVREAKPLRLSRRHVGEINHALAAIFAASAYGRITLEVARDRIDEVGVQWSVKFKGNGSDDALDDEPPG